MTQNKFKLSDFFKGLIIWICAIMTAIMVYTLYREWTTQRDEMLKRIEYNESHAAFPAQVVKVSNGKEVFIWEIGGKVYGRLCNEEQ